MVLHVQLDLRIKTIVFEINLHVSSGDSYLKPPLLSEPDIVTVQLNGNETCLVLGCDGLWEGVSASRCNDIIRTFLRNNTTDRKCVFNFLLVCKKS